VQLRYPPLVPRRSAASFCLAEHGPRKLRVGELCGLVFDALAVELPFGQLFLRDQALPATLLATGTGFAPIKAIGEHAWRRGDRRRMRLYWGGRTEEDLYMRELAHTWARRAPGFTFVPVL
jgi:CDP-4-dehydro-6-deoxyglucose reductase